MKLFASSARKCQHRLASRYVMLGFYLLLVAGCGDHEEKIAEINGEKITQSEFNAYLELKRIPKDDEAKRKAHLEDYLQREALASVAENSEYIDQRLARAEVNEFRKQMLISRHFENFLREKVDEESVRNFYASNPEQFEAEKIKVSHILIRTNDSMSKEERQAKLTQARDIHSKLMSGAEFDALAARYSEDSVSAKDGGELGWIKRGTIDPVFSERVFSMEAGEISQPFSTPFGVHIVKVEEGAKTVKRPFEKVKGDIRHRLRQKAKDAEEERMLESVEIEK